MTYIIQMKNVRKKYGEKAVVNDLTLDIKKGEFLTVVGSSGSGKTTVLKMINGLIKPDDGQIIVNGQDISKTDLISLRRSIGYCIQGSVLFPNMNVEKNISYVPDLLNGSNKEKTRQAVSKWMKIVGLDDDLRFRYPSELSGGQQQRVGIARALASSTEILLMDEPFGAVDSITRNQLQTEIKGIHQRTKVTIVFVTHDIFEALYLGTKVLVLDKGEIQQYDIPHNIIKNPKNDYVKRLLDNSFSHLKGVMDY